MATKFDIYNKVGMMNFGNTCFMNAGIQLLMSASTLMIFILTIDENEKTNNKAYIKTIKDYYNPHTTTIGPRAIYERYKKLVTKYHGGSQEDSHEFLLHILDDIIENVKKIGNMSYVTKIKKIITSTIKSDVHWKDGRDVDNTNYSEENILSFPIDDTCNTLECCKRLFLHNDNDDANITYTIEQVPKYLFIHLKRWIFDGKGYLKKCTRVDIPFHTNMFDNNHYYKLKGYIVHIGNINGGHYVAYCLKKVDNEMKWYCFNDNTVNIENNPQHSVKDAYMLLYSRE